MNPLSRLNRWLGYEPPRVQAEPLGHGPHRAQLRFDGVGSEYFRVWVVNALLTLLTLGVYSPWAKVRKTRWFAQHTVLLGERFDYHGQPLRILAGRVLALLLVVAWSVAFEINRWVGLTLLLLLCVSGPRLLAGALRFRLANTSWRGLRFDFLPPLGPVYRVAVPMLLLWTADRLLRAFDLGTAALAAAGVSAIVVLPWAHARAKAIQHGHAWFGASRFYCTSLVLPVYGVYAAALGLGLLGLVGGLVVSMVIGSWVGAASKASFVWRILLMAITFGVAWLVAWPFFATRLQRVVWLRTGLAGVRFHAEAAGWPLYRLLLWQTLCTLATAGLYWPWAAVAIARYRVQAVSVHADVAFDALAFDAARGHAGGAVGDAVADAFGLDLGL